MANIPICASCYVVDIESQSLLMIYNKKLGKWLQPGGHLDDGEIPIQTAMREVKEETGIEFKPIGKRFQNIVEPLAVETYNTRIGPMLDIQFVGIPINKEITDKENNQARWIPIEKIRLASDIDDEIKEKFEYILHRMTEKEKN